jgi:hypothetical protein
VYICALLYIISFFFIMTSTSETGHAKNVANFKELITVVKSFGTQYQPMAEALKVSALEEQVGKVEAVLNRLKDAETMEKQATATLQGEFKTLNTLSSQLMGLLISSGAKASSVEEARSVQKLIAGTRSKKKKTTSDATANESVKDTRSTSRQSYDSKLDNFVKLTTILQNVPEYKPNEGDFQVSMLQKKAKEMAQAIENNDAKEAARRQVMHERNELLYTPETGVVATAGKVKEYIKAVFGGVKSTQYKAVSKIRINSTSR